MTAQKKQIQSEGSGMPEWLVRHDVKPGEFQIVTKGQLRSQMRPDRELKVQVWACGLLHTAAYQGEVAVTMHGGKRRLLKPIDIIKELHREAIRFYKSAGIEDLKRFGELREEKEHIRRALEELEEDGLCDRKVKGRSLRELSIAERKKLRYVAIEYHFFLKPRHATPEKVHLEWARSFPPEPPISTPDPEEIQVAKIWLLKASIPKALKVFGIEKTPKPLLGNEQFVKAMAKAFSEAEKLIKEVAAPWLQGQVAAPRPLEVATPGPLEVATPGGDSERKLEIQVEKGERTASSSSPLQPESSQDDDAQPAEQDWDAVGRAAAQYGATVSDKWQRDLVAACQKRRPDVTAGEVAQLIHQKGPRAMKANKSVNGFLLAAVPELCEGESFRRFRERVRQERASIQESRKAHNFAAEFRGRWDSMSPEDQRMALEVYPELADLAPTLKAVSA